MNDNNHNSNIMEKGNIDEDDDKMPKGNTTLEEAVLSEQEGDIQPIDLPDTSTENMLSVTFQDASNIQLEKTLEEVALLEQKEDIPPLDLADISTENMLCATSQDARHAAAGNHDPNIQVEKTTMTTTASERNNNEETCYNEASSATRNIIQFVHKECPYCTSIITFPSTMKTKMIYCSQCKRVSLRQRNPNIECPLCSTTFQFPDTSNLFTICCPNCTTILSKTLPNDPEDFRNWRPCPRCHLYGPVEKFSYEICILMPNSGSGQSTTTERTICHVCMWEKTRMTCLCNLVLVAGIVCGIWTVCHATYIQIRSNYRNQEHQSIDKANGIIHRMRHRPNVLRNHKQLLKAKDIYRTILKHRIPHSSPDLHMSIFCVCMLRNDVESAQSELFAAVETCGNYQPVILAIESLLFDKAKNLNCDQQLELRALAAQVRQNSSYDPPRRDFDEEERVDRQRISF